MMIARYKNGFDGVMPRTFQQIFDNVLHESNGGRTAQAPFTLKVDAWETAEAFELMAAVPGFKKEDISIDLNDGKLTIIGERKFEREEGYKYHILESNFGKFRRSFNLPDNVNSDQITASFENGMLKVTLPKDEQKVNRRKIEITDNNTATIAVEPNQDNTKTEEQK